MKALVGVTASGKTQVSIAVAQELGAEILCVDSMTIWQRLDIGTAKPSVKDRERVPHHLLDLAPLGQRPTLASFANAAKGAISGVEARGRLPLVVGGSGLYLRAVLDDLTLAPTDPNVRGEIEQLPRDQMIRELRSLEPDIDSWLDLANPRRVIRALEIARLTGRPPGETRGDWERRSDVPIVGLQVPLEILEQRVSKRTAGMLEAGWLEEARSLDEDGLRDAVLATGAIGYRDLFAVLDGALGLDEARERIVRATLKLARRQMTWFRADPRIGWVDASDLEEASRLVLEAYS